MALMDLLSSIRVRRAAAVEPARNALRPTQSADGRSGLAGPEQALAATLHKVNTSKSTMVFEPAEMRIKKGDSIEWRNRSIVCNSITCDPKKAKKPDSAVLPAGAKPFDSGMLSKDGLLTLEVHRCRDVPLLLHRARDDGHDRDGHRRIGARSAQSGDISRPRATQALAGSFCKTA